MELIRISRLQVYEGNKYSAKCDVFSLGVTMWEILSRQIPYKDIPNELEICERIKNGKPNFYVHMYFSEIILIVGERPPIERLYVESPSKLINLVVSSWNNDAEKRPTMAFILDELKRFPTDIKELSL